MLKIVYFDSNMCDELPSKNNLPENVLKRIANKEAKSYQESLYAWWILQSLAKAYLGIKNVDVTFNENGKPLFETFYASISHSKGMIAVAISTEEIGIDIEKIVPIPHLERLIATLYAYPLDDKTDPLIHFYTTFTKKEAKIKYEGKQLGYPRHQLDVGIENVQTLFLDCKNEKYVLSYDSALYPEVFEIKSIENGVIEFIQNAKNK